MPERPETEFVRGPNGYIAYQVMGQGPPDLLLIDSWGNSIDLQWDSPLMERWLRRLASWGRVIRFDKRGEGASDTLDGGYLAAEVGTQWIEEAADDIEVVVDAVNSERAVVLGQGPGGAPAMVYAATRPDRVAGLLLIDPIVRVPVPDGEPGIDARTQQLVAGNLHRHWGKGAWLSLSAPSFAGDRELRRWFGRYERLSMPRGVIARAWEVMDLDITSVLPHVQAPTEVFVHDNLIGTPLSVAEAICAAIPGASYPRQISSPDTALWAPHEESVYADLHAFVRRIAGAAPPARADRVFAVVLFTDVVGSTSQLAEVGDQRWQELLDVHDSVARREIERARGRLVNQTGDGVVATFDAPARAIACARAIGAQLRYVGVEVRAGLHAGEIELRGDNVGGIAVHIAARVIGFADAGEVVVSSTVKDLVAGSGLQFDDRGHQMLKGIPEPWRLYAVQTDPMPL